MYNQDKWRSYIVFIWMVLFLKGALSLKCYKCLSLSCPDSTIFCDRVKRFVLEELQEIYFNQGSRILFCPDTTREHASAAWDYLKSTSSIPCEEENGGEATCVLGRFKVTTLVMDTKQNITSYGTSMGCAKWKLLKHIKLAKFRQSCDLAQSQSVVKESIKHFFEIEHCPVMSDMCSAEDFCISPNSSVIKAFQDDTADKPEESEYPIKLIIGISLLIVIAICVGVIFIFGIKYDVM